MILTKILEKTKDYIVGAAKVAALAGALVALTPSDAEAQEWPQPRDGTSVVECKAKDVAANYDSSTAGKIASLLAKNESRYKVKGTHGKVFLECTQTGNVVPRSFDERPRVPAKSIEVKLDRKRINKDLFDCPYTATLKFIPRQEVHGQFLPIGAYEHFGRVQFSGAVTPELDLELNAECSSLGEPYVRFKNLGSNKTLDEIKIS